MKMNFPTVPTALSLSLSLSLNNYLSIYLTLWLDFLFSLHLLFSLALTLFSLSLDFSISNVRMHTDTHFLPLSFFLSLFLSFVYSSLFSCLAALPFLLTLSSDPQSLYRGRYKPQRTYQDAQPAVVSILELAQPQMKAD